MTLKTETRRGQLFQIGEAAFQFIDVRAAATAEVMVVALAGGFVERVFAREIHRNQQPLIGKRLDSAIHGGDTKLRKNAARGLKNLLYSQGSIRSFKHQLDGVALSGLSVHEAYIFRGTPLAQASAPAERWRRLKRVYNQT